MPAYPIITTPGDLLIGGASGVETRLPGNTSTGLKFLRSVGDGSNAAGPSWEELDIASVSGLTAALDGKETIGAAATLAATLGDLATLDAVTKSLVSDLETITATPTASAIPKADGSGKIANGWLNTGSGNGIDADKLDSYEAAAFPKLATDNTFTGANQVGTSSSDRVKLTAPTIGATPQVDSVIANGFNLALRNSGTGGRAYYFCATNDLYGSGGGRLILLDNATSTGSAALTLLSGKFGFGVGNIAPTAVIDSNGDTIRLRTSKTPASASATGNAGDICWDSSYIYVCTATNTWKRTALTSW